MKKIFAIVVLWFCFSQAYGQLKFVNEFLNIGVGARAHGMSGSVVANTSDATSAYWNTAGLTELTAPLSVSAMHANWFGNIAGYDYFTIAKRLNNNQSYGAISFIRFGIDNIPNTLNLVNPDGTIDFDRVTTFSANDFAFLLSYARKIGTSEKLSVGGNVKIIRRVIGEFGGAWGFGADVSARYKASQKLRFGVMLRDVTTTFNAWSFTLDEKEKEVFTRTGNDIPISSTEITLPRIIIGSAYITKLSSNIDLLTELDLNISTNGTKAGVLAAKNFSVDPSFGAEIGYAKKVFLRLGVGNIQRTLNDVNSDKRELDFQPNVGLGVKLGRLGIDYALSNVGNVSGVLASHIFSLNLDLAEKKSAE